MDSQYSKQHHTVQTQPGGQPGAYYGNPGNPYGPGSQQASHHTNTTVIIQQPAAAVGVRDWSTGLCNCCDDVGICLCGLFCSCCLAMQVSSDMDETMCLPWCVPYYLMALRVKMRAQERIQGSICNDCLVQTYCGTCALCQLAREVKMVKQRAAR
ncbi:unnamed protein product [Candidula unifasciata]|uniref:Uncharacterized protein n=1 Tax=Candidula unifasciata TaxID=100452 RepID=A0A8S3YSC4_9EUPU|nr:unnamed protein product [Candidula unifasciata]